MRKSSIPNIFTFINLSFGILSLLATFESNYQLACIFILLAALVDRYDGRIARYLQVSSDLGKEPSILIFLLFDFYTLGPSKIFGIIPLLLFPICGAFRLARYNASEFNGVFTGVPITVTGSFLALFCLFTINKNISALIPFLLLLLGSYLMVSTLKLKKF